METYILLTWSVNAIFYVLHKNCNITYHSIAVLCSNIVVTDEIYNIIIKKIRTEPNRTDPILSYPNVTDSIRSYPNETDSIRSYTIQSDPIRSNPILSDPMRSYPILPEPNRNEPNRSDFIRTNANK